MHTSCRVPTHTYLPAHTHHVACLRKHVTHAPHVVVPRASHVAHLSKTDTPVVHVRSTNASTSTNDNGNKATTYPNLSRENTSFRKSPFAKSSYSSLIEALVSHVTRFSLVNLGIGKCGTSAAQVECIRELECPRKCPASMSCGKLHVRRGYPPPSLYVILCSSNTSNNRRARNRMTFTPYHQHNPAPT
jgi:hypothetical protein